MNDKRIRMKTFRLTPSEFDLLDLIARREGRNQSETLRECIREAAMHRGMFPAGLVTIEKARTP